MLRCNRYEGVFDLPPNGTRKSEDLTVLQVRKWLSKYLAYSGVKIT
ncbi:MAG: hypothetical protein ACJAVO_001436 [Parvibaculaceae bacterium]|jgi:hypothetical protein